MHVFNYRSFIVVLFVVGLFGCAGTTTVFRNHHLLQKDSAMVQVGFLRPKKGFSGVYGKPVEINLDGEVLLNLSKGQYTFLELRPGKYDMVVTSTTIEGPKNMETKTSRYFVLDLAKADSVYLLFGIELHDFWQILIDKGAEEVRKTEINVSIAKQVILKAYPFSNFGDSKPGYGCTVQSVNRKIAMAAASELEPVKGTQKLIIQK